MTKPTSRDTPRRRWLAIEGESLGGVPTPTQRAALQAALRDAMVDWLRTGEAVPREMLEAVAAAAIDVCNGHAPALFQPVGTGKKVQEGARQARMVAGGYIAAGESDTVRAERAREVAKLYEVHPRTARDWGSTSTPLDLAEGLRPESIVRAWARVYRRLRPQRVKVSRRA